MLEEHTSGPPRHLGRPHRLAFDLLRLVEHFAGRLPAIRLTCRRAEARLQAAMLAALSDAPPGRLRPVDRVEHLTPRQFHASYLARRHPVVFAGLARHWPAISRWTPEHLAALADRDDAVLWDHAPSSARRATFGEVARSIARGEATNLRFDALLHRHPTLERDDLDLPSLAPYRDPGTRSGVRDFFMGARGTHTLTHCAMSNNLFVQVLGVKRWRLWGSSWDPAMRWPVHRTPFFSSDYDPDHPDPTRYPLSPFMHGLEVDLSPGDVLYVPPFWWHHVSNLSTSIGIACRWQSPRGLLRTSPAKALMTLAATNPPVLKVIRAHAARDFTLPFLSIRLDIPD